MTDSSESGDTSSTIRDLSRKIEDLEYKLNQSESRLKFTIEESERARELIQIKEKELTSLNVEKLTIVAHVNELVNEIEQLGNELQDKTGRDPQEFLLERMAREEAQKR